MTKPQITVISATIAEHQQVAELFEQYRQFYQKPADFEQASQFIKQRLQNQDSTILLATYSGKTTLSNPTADANQNSTINHACGFVQLYPSFSSTNMQKMYILNDLFVSENFRKMSIATTLMNAAKAYAITQNAHSIKLCTAIDNHQAKALYQKLGYQQITTFDSLVSF